ncbi:hypothetical protein BKA67DRAFT_426584 [Truncatella angustata]|uniref:Uncharacterized protein n=1 Tax=Truncatella angustata TaxID=152316 RepID=A0A9P8RJD9_9PEZI|nr:uncharacterized protein BKA67DRAFT_426584 [Truncatella angustata]KAH6647118.1 hypothetical protein BKA67DRAFT_426584 [Truncatella angustata]
MTYPIYDPILNSRLKSLIPPQLQSIAPCRAEMPLRARRPSCDCHAQGMRIQISTKVRINEL